MPKLTNLEIEAETEHKDYKKTKKKDKAPKFRKKVQETSNKWKK